MNLSDDEYNTIRSRFDTEGHRMSGADSDTKRPSSTYRRERPDRSESDDGFNTPRRAPKKKRRPRQTDSGDSDTGRSSDPSVRRRKAPRANPEDLPRTVSPTPSRRGRETSPLGREPSHPPEMPPPRKRKRATTAAPAAGSDETGSNDVLKKPRASRKKAPVAASAPMISPRDALGPLVPPVGPSTAGFFPVGVTMEVSKRKKKTTTKSSVTLHSSYSVPAAIDPYLEEIAIVHRQQQQKSLMVGHTNPCFLCSKMDDDPGVMANPIRDRMNRIQAMYGFADRRTVISSMHQFYLKEYVPYMKNPQEFTEMDIYLHIVCHGQTPTRNAVQQQINDLDYLEHFIKTQSLLTRSPATNEHEVDWGVFKQLGKIAELRMKLVKSVA